MPYVAMFFFSVVLKDSFQAKYDREMKDLSAAVIPPY